MIRNFYIIILVMSFFVFGAAQSLHIIETSGLSFTPDDITVAVNDTVRWINSSGGFHDVVADDGSYSSGSPSSSQWVFDYVFTTTGDSRYYCSVHGNTGGVGMSGIVHVTPATNISEDKSVIVKYNLAQNYPNPFNPTTKIDYNLPNSDHVNLTIFNSSGQKVQTLVNTFQSKGNQTVTWDSRNDKGNLVSSGIYFYVLKTGNQKILSKKMILQR